VNTFSDSLRWEDGRPGRVAAVRQLKVRDGERGGYFARALGHSIFTEADAWDDLRTNVLEATSLHFEDGPLHPRLVQPHHVKDELIPVKAA